MRPKPASEIGATNSTPLASSSATVASMSSHIRNSSWRPLSSGAVGWHASSAGGSAKISQPPPASTLRSSSVSAKNARAACGVLGRRRSRGRR